MNGQRLSPGAVAALRASDHRIVITGAGGWLGSATLELLRDALGGGFDARVLCYGSSARKLVLRDGLAITQRPLGELPDLDPRPTLVLHLAFLTKDRVAGMAEADYVAANEALSGIVAGALDRIGATAVFVASSGAARAADDPAAAPAMRLYGALKKRDESTFADWAIRADRTAVVTRIFNVAGPFINKHQDYALAAFINDALAGRPIVVRAPHRVMRGFVAIRELMSLAFLLLLEKGARVTSFDTGGDALELGEVARVVAETLGPVTVERAAITSDRVDDYVGDRTAYDRLLARYEVAAVPLPDQIRDTAESLVADNERIR